MNKLGNQLLAVVHWR